MGFTEGWVWMKTWHLRRGRNISRVDFGWSFYKNVEELLLSMFLRVRARACVCSLYSCVHSSILAYVGMFLSLCVCGNGPMYARSCLRVWALTRVREMPCRSLTLPIFTPFSTISHPYAILTPLFVNLAFEIHYIILFIFILHQNTISLNFTWIMDLISSFFLQSSSKYIGSGRTNKVVEWFNLLAPETRDYI